MLSILGNTNIENDVFKTTNAYQEMLMTALSYVLSPRVLVIRHHYCGDVPGVHFNGANSSVSSGHQTVFQHIHKLL